MSEPDNIKKKSAAYEGLHQRIHETVQHRSESRDAWEAWQQACRDFHNYESPMQFIETSEGRKRLRQGDPQLLEYSIRFLELDPYVFRSGYAKAAIIRCIKQLTFSDTQTQRLRGVILQVLDKCDRQEFRAYCRLAATLDSSDFEDQIRERLNSSDDAVCRRTRYILDYLENWRLSL